MKTKKINVQKLVWIYRNKLDHYITSGRYTGLRVKEVISTHPKYMATHHQKITTQKL